MLHNFRIYDFENAIIRRKICDMQVLAKYAIAYSHTMGIPEQCNKCPDSSTHFFAGKNPTELTAS